MANSQGIFLVVASNGCYSSWITKSKKYASYIDPYHNNILNCPGEFISKMYIILQDDVERKLEIHRHTFDEPVELIGYEMISPNIAVVDRIIRTRQHTIHVNRRCVIYTLEHQMNLEYMDQSNVITLSSEYYDDPYTHEDREIIVDELDRYFNHEKLIIDRYLFPAGQFGLYQRYQKHIFKVIGTEINIAPELNSVGMGRSIANILFIPKRPIKPSLLIHGIEFLLIKRRKAKIFYNTIIPKNAYLIVFHGCNINYNLVNFKPTTGLKISRITDMKLKTALNEIEIQTSYLIN